MNARTGKARGRIITLALGILLLVLVHALPRSGGVWARVAWGVRPRVHAVGYGLKGEAVNVGGWLPVEINHWTRELLSSAFRPPIPARVVPPRGDIWTEIPGLHVNLGVTAESLLTASPGKPVAVATVEVAPVVGRQVLESMNDELGGFSTWGMGGGPRNYNLYLGAVLIDWTLILPGQVFSFWEQVGPPTAERGFEPAPVIVGGSVMNLPGGGLCQVSTTLYNAALEAGMEMVERHIHTMPVGYVGPGMDATVAWEYLDLKFRNPAPWPVMVRMGYAGGLLWARILGPDDHGN